MGYSSSCVDYPALLRSGKFLSIMVSMSVKNLKCMSFVLRILVDDESLQSYLVAKVFSGICKISAILHEGGLKFAL